MIGRINIVVYYSDNIFIALDFFINLFIIMPRKICLPSMLLISEVNQLSYRQLQFELKARNLKAAGKTEVLRERLRKSIINKNEDDQMSDYLDECSICLDKLSFDKLTTIMTTCLHQYHRNCLKKWIESNSEYSLCCPLCRCSLANDRHIEQGEDKKIIV